MKRVIINEGIVHVKKDGVVYEMTPSKFHKIKAIVFDSKSSLCQTCKFKANCGKTFNESYIVDGLTTKFQTQSDYVFACKNYMKKAKENYYFGVVGTENPESEYNPNDKYVAGFSAHIVHENVQKVFRR